MNQLDFLNKKSFDEIYKLLPEDGWQEAKVYSISDKKSFVNEEFRKSEKNFEKRRDVLKIIKKNIMKPLINFCKQNIENFQYIWIRSNHTEWIKYYEGNFFKSHKDFEKYICNGMNPYVVILGLNDVEEGGETKVENIICNGSCRKNGMVFFKGNLDHESLIVKKGIKIALKLEFFIYIGNDFTRVSDEEKKWTSFWGTKELNLFDNYFKSQLHFENAKNDIDTKDLIISEELAKYSHNLGLMIADPKIKLESEIELLFPLFTINSLHDLFIINNFLNDVSQKFIFCNDNIAWEYLNEKIDLPSNCGVFVGLWDKKYKNSEYVFSECYNRIGEKYYSNNRSINKFTDYDSIKINILNEYLNKYDKFNNKKIKLNLKDGKNIIQNRIEYLLKKKIKPSDEIQKPIFEKGTVTITEKEFCNDEESGYDIYTYKEYEQSYIQIRFVLFRI